MAVDAAVRELLSKMLAWNDAHVGFDAAVANIAPEMRGKQPAGLPYSPWQLVEHLRRAQHDILDFCKNPHYKELSWPDDYWPASPAPPSASAWDESIDALKRDRQELQQLAVDPKIDLMARIPHGDGQTYGREILLAADHAAYHVGQLVAVRRLLGIWTN
jgi:uncharacterized damage-inducible protein DinB